MAQVEKLLIFLASPGDVPKERRYVQEVIDDLNRTLASQKNIVLQVVTWEKDAFPGYGMDAQALINAQIAEMEKYSLFVGIIWNRLGTPTPRGASGTAEEFERAKAALEQHGHPNIWFYFRKTPASLDTDEQLEQRKKVLEFRKLVESKGLPWSYKNPSDFQDKFRDHMMQWLNSLNREAATVAGSGLQRDNLQSLELAVQGLSSEKLSDRLDSIRALESITKVTEKHNTEILSALAHFVREKTPWRPNIVNNGIGEDLQLALSLIGILPKRYNGNLYRVEMHNVDISGANLENANLEGAVLWGSNLRNVVLARSNLKGADLGGVDFTDASLEMADLEGAFLWMSSLLEPIRPCILDRTRLAGANLKDAHLEAAILANAFDLGETQVHQAITNEHTRLPMGIRRLTASEATRQFIVGRWQVEQKIADMEGGSFIDYFEDGTFFGRRERFKEGLGERIKVSGTWDFMRLAADQFRMTLKFNDGEQWQGSFRIVDHEHIHNVDENYIAVRVPQ